MQIVFIGDRWKDFSLTLPVTGGQLYVIPREKLEVSEEDGQVILGDVTLDFISGESFDEFTNRPQADAGIPPVRGARKKG